MLYRDPQTAVSTSFLLRLRSVFTALGRGRRRRLAELDLSTASRHLRQDLGLEDVDLFRR
jgi:hypothetical protein